MYEVVVNLHMHTRYSDGNAGHSEIAAAAARSGLDAVIVTDHNVYVEGPEDIYKFGDRRVTLLVGEEIHDQARQPQKNHLLVFGAGRELAHLAYDLPRLLEAVRQVGGLAYLAHPHDPAAPVFGEADLSWEAWPSQGIQGIEAWNALSEFKTRLKSRLHGAYYALNPHQIARAPFSDVLGKWDELLNEGRRLSIIGGSDAHALPMSMGPIHRIIFPYDFHFQTVNTHLYLPVPLGADIEENRRLILDALGKGRGFVGYDLPASTRGFRFTAQGRDRTAWMGEEISAQHGVTLQVRLPQPVECRLLRNGKVLKTWVRRNTCAHITTEPGIFRVEAFIDYLGETRGWIYSNPIYVTR
jgi:hypothetical protein